jgi:hypothetical protein
VRENSCGLREKGFRTPPPPSREVTVNFVASEFVFWTFFNIDIHLSDGSPKEQLFAEPKQCSQRPVIGWVTKIYYLELLRASEGTLSRWSRLNLQSLTPPPVSRRVDVRQAAWRKNNCRIYSQHD